MTGPKNQSICISTLTLHPDNARGHHGYDKDKIEAFAASIQAVGLLAPLVVQQIDGGKFGVLDGGHRLQALQACGLSRAKIPCRVLPKGIDSTTAISLAGNVMHEPMKPIEEYEAFAKCVDQGLTPELISKSFGTTVRQVNERLCYGRVHPDIRNAARKGDITLDVLKAFAGHPAQDIQLQVFKDLSTNRSLAPWTVRARLADVDVLAGSQLGKFVEEDYRQQGGETIDALVEELTVLVDRQLAEEIAADKLRTMAAQVAAEHGFGWAEGRLSFDYGEFAGCPRIYPKRSEPEGDDAARLAAIRNEQEALDDKFEEASDEDFPGFESRYDELEKEAAEIERRYERYDPNQASKAGVIVALGPDGPQVHAGLMRKEDQQAADSGDQGQDDGAVQTTKKTSPLTKALSLDLNVDRADAVQAALLDQPGLAQDGLLFAMASKTLAYSAALPGIDLQCRAAMRVHSQPDARAAATLNAIEARRIDLDLTWLDDGLAEGEQFEAFCALSSVMKGKIAAWCLGALMSPGLNSDGQVTFVQTLAALALPNIRANWTPTAENYWSRVSKAHILDVLRGFGMRDEAHSMRGEKKATLVSFMDRLFQSPPSTLTGEQVEAVNAWTPDGMATTSPEDDEEETVDEGEDALAA